MEREMATWGQRLEALVAFEENPSHAAEACKPAQGQREWYSGATHLPVFSETIHFVHV